jgi:hypothetical protein
VSEANLHARWLVAQKRSCFRFLGGYLAVTWRLLGGYLAVTWRLLGGYLAVTWRLPGGYLAVAWRTSGEHVSYKIDKPNARAVWRTLSSFAHSFHLCSRVPFATCIVEHGSHH